MKVIIASDSHQRTSKVLDEIKATHPEASLFLHAGDLEGKAVPGWICVGGNADEKISREKGLPAMDQTKIVEADGHRILLIHGHQFAAKKRAQKLAALARENCCDMVVCGHSHRFGIQQVNGILILNPGSLIRPAKGETAGYIEWDAKTDQIERFSLNSQLKKTGKTSAESTFTKNNTN